MILYPCSTSSLGSAFVLLVFSYFDLFVLLFYLLGNQDWVLAESCLLSTASWAQRCMLLPGILLILPCPERSTVLYSFTLDDLDHRRH